VCMDGFCFPRYGCISFNIVCARVCVCVRLAPKPPPCVIVVFLLTYLCVCVSLYWQGFQQVPLVLVVPSPQIYINELRKSSNVTGWKCPQVGQQHVTQRSRV
jgi:hypothetical protein